MQVVQNLLKDPKFAQNPAKSYSKAFVDANTQLHRHHIDDSMSGTTAIALCIRGKQISVANVGDSRATSGIWNGKKLIAMDLSTDQTPFRCATAFLKLKSVCPSKSFPFDYVAPCCIQSATCGKSYARLLMFEKSSQLFSSD